MESFGSDVAQPFDTPLHFDDLAKSESAEFDLISPHLSTPPAALLSLIEDPSTPSVTVFHVLYALLTRWTRLTAKDRASTLDATRTYVSSTCTAPVAAQLHRAAFLMWGLCTAGESPTDATSRKAWDRRGGREACLESARGLCEAGGSLTPPQRAPLASALLRAVLAVADAPGAPRDRHARATLGKLLAAVLVLDPAQALPANAGLVHALMREEHAGPVVGEAVVASGEWFVKEFVAELARVDGGDLARDAAAAKSCAACLAEIADRCPRVLMGMMPVVLGVLDGESYSMRNGVLHALGNVLVALRHDEEQDVLAREGLLDVLLERARRDVHAYTRSKALQIWVFLAESRSIPYRRLADVASVAQSRLDDKTAAVRRAAAQLLSALLKTNAFGPALRLAHYDAKHAEFGGDNDDSMEGDSPRTGEDDEVQSENGGDGGSRCSQSDVGGSTSYRSVDDGNAESDEGGDDSVVGESKTPSEDRRTGDSGSSADSGDGSEQGVESPTSPEEEESDAEEVKRLFYKSAVDFIRAVEGGLEKAYELLRSTIITDVSESVNLLVTAVQFQLGAASGRAVRAMLVLVLAKEVNIKTAAINAYQALLAPDLDTYAADGKESALPVANGLIALVAGATTGEVACVETLVENMMQNDPCLISPAVMAIMWDMFSGKIPGVSVERRCAACIFIGMFAAVKPETLQARVSILQKVGLDSEEKSFVLWTCVALRKLPLGSDSDRTISTRLLSLVEGECELSAIEQALNAVYRLHPSPEEDVSAMIHRLSKAVFADLTQTSTEKLSRFLLIVGHVAVKQLVRVEALASEIRRLAKKEEEEQAGAESEKALEFAERELTLPNSLLGQYGALARKITRDEQAPDELRASAVLCMSKLMCVNAAFCEANLQLLFTVLERASQASVRANTITALGDLAFRFPNLVEPWSARIYKALEDNDVRVRKNALMALTHLILNDMVKVKGQLVGLALRVLDADQRVADLARVFFHELSRKSANAIYNLLPDTISCLSRRDDVTVQDVKKVMTFLMGFIEKGWQAEGLVDKLCQRFRTSESTQESRDIAFCIAQLSLTEKCLARLIDSFKLYSATLMDDDVHQYLVGAVSKAKKALAPVSGSKKSSEKNVDGSESKHRADELLEKIEKHRSNTGDEEPDEE